MLRPALLRYGCALSFVLTCFAPVSSSAATLANVRVNDLAYKNTDAPNDVRPAIALEGRRIVAVWNRGGSHSAYAWSSDGGRTFRDGGALYVPGLWSQGDPAVTTDRGGNFYTASTNVDMTDYEHPRYWLHVHRGAFSGPEFTWDAPVTALQVPAGSFTSECAVAADPSDGTVYVAFVARELPWVGFTSSVQLIRSTDHGATWSAPVQLARETSPVFLSGTRIAVGPTGEVVVLYVHREGVIGTAYAVVRRSIDRGFRFAAATNVPADYLAMPFLGCGPPGSNLGYAGFQPSLAVDTSTGPHRGRIYVTWAGSVDTRFDVLGAAGNGTEVEPNNSAAAPMVYSIGSTVSGEISSTADTDWYRFSGAAGQTLVAATAPNGSGGWCSLALYGGQGMPTDQVAYSNYSGANGSLVFTLPTTGTYWLSVAYRATSSTPTPYLLRTAWHTPRNTDVVRDARDIVLLASDNGTNWTPRPITVNSDAPHFDNSMPEVAVDAAGQVHVIWYDHRDDPTQGRRTAVYHSLSRDGGLTFAPDDRIDSGPGSLFVTLPTYFSDNIGNRIGLVSDGCRLLAAFTDGRSGRADVWTQVLYGGPASGSAVTVRQSADSSGIGSPATFVATLTPVEAGTTIQFTDGGLPVGAPVEVDAVTGEAHWTVQDLAVGTHQISARFEGNGCFTASAGGAVAHVVSATNTYFALNVQVVGSGTVTRDPEIDLHPRGTTVHLRATAAPGWRFAGWTGDVVDTSASPSVLMEADHAVVATFVSRPQAVYRWTPAGLSTSFTSSSNWTPTRAVLDGSDVLVFDNGLTNSVTVGAADEVGRIVVRGQTQVRFLVPVGATNAAIAISGGDEPQLLVEPGARLTLSGSAPITLALAAGTRGEIAGQVDVSGGPHRLLAAGANALQFLAGSSVTTGAGFAGNLFGTGVAPGALGSVEFLAGSTYVQAAGGHPFGANAPASVVTFRPGSRFRLRSPTGASLAGREYADFEHDIGSTTLVAGLNAVTCDSLIVTRGTVRLTQGGPTRLRGDLRVAAGAALELAPATGLGELSFEGTTPQHFRIDGVLSMSPATRWRLADPAGLELLADWTPERDVVFAGGRLDTGPYRLVISDTVNVLGASPDNGWVNGTMTRQVPAGSSTRRFDVGDAARFAPVQVALREVAGEGALSVRTSSGDHPQLAATELAADRTVNRVWTLDGSSLGAFRDADAVFGFGAPDVDPDADPSRFLVRRWDGTAWSAESTGTALPGRTEAVGLRAFGEFVLGNPPRPAATPPSTALVFAISSVTPNPVRDVAVVRFDLPVSAPVRLRLFDLQGRIVSTLVDAELGAGRHSVELNTGSLDVHRKAGLLFLRLEAPGVSRQRRIVLTP